ncbi:Hsp20/alpha crystallin family protein [Bordetella sp. 2513F-2]
MPASSSTPLARAWPTPPLAELHRDMDRLFDTLLGGTGLREFGAVAMPQLELCENDGDLCVSAELPGVQPGDVDVRLSGDVLVISGEKRDPQAQRRTGAMHVSERSYGRFQRTLTLPFAPDPAKTRATLEHGVLRIELGRREDAPASHRITVQGSQAGGHAPQDLPDDASGTRGEAAPSAAAQGRVPEI